MTRWPLDHNVKAPVVTLPYGRQTIDEDDIKAVVEVLRSDYLTTGPKVERFEQMFSDRVGAQHAVAVSSGTAALHAAIFAAGIGPGDEVIVPPITFASTANCVVFQGGTPVFADVSPDTLLIDPSQVARKVTSRTKAIIAVDFAGQPCDYDALREIAEYHGLTLVADACHSLGGALHGNPVGVLADLNAFSFHPVKHITTGEGGMITTNDADAARRIRSFRNHGIATDHRERARAGSHFYEMVDLGYNYRLSDLQCALGITQLGKLQRFVDRRREIAASYDSALSGFDWAFPLHTREGAHHAYHLYVARIESTTLGCSRDQALTALRTSGFGVNVHYIPVHLHPYYRGRYGTVPGLCPEAERAYEEILSLPIFPMMSDGDVQSVIDAFRALGA